MRLKIVACPCGNPAPHKRFRSGDGGWETDSFFSIARGQGLLRELQADGVITLSDVADAQVQLENCGLKQETDHTESDLILLSADIITSRSPSLREMRVAEEINSGFLSEQLAVRVRELVANPEGTLDAAEMENLKTLFAGFKAKDREKALSDGIRTSFISTEQAENLREFLKDAPVTRSAEVLGATEEIIVRRSHRSFRSGRDLPPMMGSMSMN